MEFAQRISAAFPTSANVLFNWQGTPIIIGSCLFVLLIASQTIKYPHRGAKMPLCGYLIAVQSHQRCRFFGIHEFWSHSGRAADASIGQRLGRRIKKALPCCLGRAGLTEFRF
jgi:hypothetical protein